MFVDIVYLDVDFYSDIGHLVLSLEQFEIFGQTVEFHDLIYLCRKHICCSQVKCKVLVGR